MSDFTSEAAIPARGPRAPRTEFCVYFGIIFLATLPLAVLTWGLSALKSGSLTDKGPIARAWSQARIITPMIFSA
ncbi:cytochrome PufQ [Tranquillimonas alkanivorans]|uniref:PufQ cytochrome subunit n=1 Tax=Tranquillimonas alkanivorans TaxID=441119 RepID=A0A1I5LFN8_9RHOB|nr:cytochrome PufQ [Tranquillimonas alkanivorans]SFO95531.1 PufQ cytochrome subunit [Tranquillimonas alkanivorans]